MTIVLMIVSNFGPEMHYKVKIWFWTTDTTLQQFVIVSTNLPLEVNQ